MIFSWKVFLVEWLHKIYQYSLQHTHHTGEGWLLPPRTRAWHGHMWRGLLCQCQTRRSSFSSYAALHPAGGTKVTNCSNDARNIVTHGTDFLTRNPPLHLGVNPHFSPVSTGYQLPGVSYLDWMCSAGTSWATFLAWGAATSCAWL